ncbi:hypothetical protein SELMODRAFT_142341 [Selaginella moellendorffii]|uniref:Adaptor protein ClpS core domain-containing protein n=1 Tax=Selaginella moellendorffii TaxID=88036 RepID=D8QZG3_SELML|nr:ATP-dependent Clp protease adapter protein CLPS1, chloroplastic isoform X2 [Selaginella moellendorffii]XP_002975455.1 ATP-dependent Clp protease adapter protein CLPS1, chloroplastic [Selaginella moellendorffii]XP_024536075.1 ATP-dependent Clp protease adapter protein CLPS1, chloroplastic [Selaginella moellendorffii]XP_024536076.1 ATP-dependent Clp protease adapter protein CLPS1, chloroplastic [Selaginella moellendorffii]XP_024536077.1 ATP-dependent Clp protease adapter protein CLPS1, chlorop|eukprot:XP_002964066.1 ATP-dependent Clp protease adapter protein CLPS1, chloroplastic isoform X2 [Selaginella moellendorffii]
MACTLTQVAHLWPSTSQVSRFNTIFAEADKCHKCFTRIIASHAVRAALPGGLGGGVLDKPAIETAPTPGRESEFDLRKKKKMAPPYRVILHNDNFNRREYVVQVLMKVIPGMTLDNAVNIMQEAHHNGLSVVIVCSQEDAEEHCTQLRANGLLSSIEPASGGSC